MPARLAKVASIGSKVAGVAVAAVVVALLALEVVIPRFTGTVPLTVLTGSMTPNIPQGSLVMVKPTPTADLHVGDVITFETEPQSGHFVTHRIIAATGEGQELTFTTKGDANPGEDIDPVPAAAVRGRVVFHLPYVGGIADKVRSRQGIALLVLLPVALLLGSSLRDGLRRLRERRQPQTQSATAVEAAVATDVEPTDVAAAAPSPAAIPARRPAGPVLVGAGRAVTRQLLLATVELRSSGHRDVGELVDLLGGKVVDVAHDLVTVMVTGTPERLDDIEVLLSAWRPVALVRSDAVSVPGLDPAAFAALLLPGSEGFELLAPSTHRPAERPRA